MGYAIGIDIGGTGIKAAVVDLERGRLATQRRRVLTPRPAGPRSMTKAIAELLASPEFEGHAMAGAGFPGAIKRDTIYSAPNLDREWVGVDGAAVIGAAIGRSVTLLNDADAAGLAEVRFGAGRGEQGVVAMVTLGTGIGCGLFVDGMLVPNMELGHIEIRGKDAECRAAASVRDRKKLSWKAWSVQVEEYLNTLDRLIWPDLIIVGGGVSATPEKFLPRIKTRVKVVSAALGNGAGIIGAAMWARERSSHG